MFTFAITASKSPCVGGSPGVLTKSDTMFGFRAVAFDRLHLRCAPATPA